MVDDLTQFVRGVALVSRWRRAIHLLVCVFVPAFLTMSALDSFFVGYVSVGEAEDLRVSAVRLSTLQQREGVGTGLSNRAVEEREALEIYIASQFGHWLVERPSGFPEAVIEDYRELLERTVEAHPTPSVEAVRKAREIVEPLLESERTPVGRPTVGGLVFQALLGTSTLIAVVGTLSAAAFRGGLVLRLLGIGVVTRNGTEASRLRAFGRALVATSPPN